MTSRKTGAPPRVPSVSLKPPHVMLPEGYVLHAYATLESTNATAMTCPPPEGACGVVVWAQEQRGGKGRQGRAWDSPKGNLYASIRVQPRRPLAECAQLSFIAALAVAEAMDAASQLDLPILLKWPNDVLLQRKKVAGILLESRFDAGQLFPTVIIGIGINLVSYPEQAHHPATALNALTQTALPPETMLEALVERWHMLYRRWQTEGFAWARSAWLARSVPQGRILTARLPDKTITGTYMGLDESGALLLETGEALLTITSGDVFFGD